MKITDQIRRELEPRARRLCGSKDWQMGNFLGAGATAATFEVATSQGIRALKLYVPRFLKGKRGDQVRRRFRIVLDHLRDHQCPHLITVHEGGEAEDTLYLLMLRAPGNCLGNVLKSVPPGNIREIVRQVAIAAKYLEEMGLCHRDIKSDNVTISQDHTNAVLLDLGVVRWLDEEGTSGTDEEGQLPFVATAQYSSPEYMFRLVPPGPDLWRGLTFYQLGGLLHDLIMKEKLFQDIAERSAENRYLIAHAVATIVPSIANDGSVPLDLILLAQRALEKDLSRRLTMVEWDDFLGDNRTRQNEIILGLRSGRTVYQARTPSYLADWTRQLDDALDKKLTGSGIHCQHHSKVTAVNRGTLKLEWPPSIDRLPPESKIVVEFELQAGPNAIAMQGSSELKIAGKIAAVLKPRPIVTLPAKKGEEAPSGLTEHAYEAFISLSANLVTKFLNEQASEGNQS